MVSTLQLYGIYTPKRKYIQSRSLIEKSTSLPLWEGDSSTSGHLYP
jgi:hypothetical protein